MDRRSITANNGPLAENASQSITVRHFTGSDACHIINILFYFILFYFTRFAAPNKY
jgi:hypothetical protein